MAAQGQGQVSVLFLFYEYERERARRLIESDPTDFSGVCWQGHMICSGRLNR